MANDFNLSGTVEFNINPVRKSSAALSSQIKSMNNSLKAQEKAFKQVGMSSEELAKRENTLKGAIKAQAEVLKVKEQRLKSVKAGITDFNNMTAKQAKQLDSARAAVSREEYALSGLKNELARTNTRQNDLKNSTVKLTDEIRDLELQNKKVVNSLKAQGKEAEALKADYKGLSAINEKYSSLLQKENAKLKQLRDSMGAQSREAKQQERYVDQLAKRHGFLISQQGKTKASLDRMSGSMKTATNRAKELGSRVQGMGRSTMGVGRSMAAGLTLPMVTGLGAAIKTTVDWEDALANVRKTIDPTTDNIDTLGKSIRDMAKEMPQSQQEIGNTMSMAAQLGIKGTENLKNFTEIATQMGVATNMSSEEAATAMARIANITGMPTDKMKNLGSTIVNLGNNMAAQEGEITDFMMRLSGTGTTVGLAEKDIGALSAAMAGVGINAEAGGSAMSKVMSKINTAVMSGGKSLEGFAEVSGMSGKEFAKLWESDPYKAIQKFEGGVKNAVDAGENHKELLSELGITELRETDTVLRLANGNKQLADARTHANKGWKEGTALSDEAQQKYKSLGNQMKIFMNNVRDVGISMGEAMAPAITGLMKAMTPLLNSLAKAPEPMRALIAILAMVAAAIGPVIIGIGALTASWGAIAAATGLALGPIALIVAALVGLGVAFVTSYSKSEKFRDIVTGAISAVGKSIKNAYGIITGFFKLLGGWSSQGDGISILTKLGLSTEQIQAISGFADKIREILNGMGKAISKMFSQMKIGDAFKNMFAGIADFFKKDGAQILEALGNIATGIAAVFKFIWPIISYIIKDLWNSIKGFVTGLLTVVKGVIQVLTGIFTGDFSKIGEGLKNIFMGALQAVWNGINLMLYGKIFKGVKVFGGLFKNFFVNMWNGIKSIFTGGGGGFATIFYGIWSNLLKNIRTLWTGLKTFFINVWAGITTPMIASATYIRTALLSIFRVTVAVIKTVFTGLRTFFSAFWAGVKLLFSASVTVVKNVSVAIFKGLVAFVKSIFTGLRSFFSNFWVGVKILFTKYVALVRLVTTTAFRLLVAIVKTVFNGLRAFFVGFWSIVRALFVRTVTGIKNVTVSIFRILGTIIRTIFNALRKFFVSFWSITRSIFVKTVTGIKNATLSLFRALSSITRAIFNALRKFFSSVWSIIRSIFIKTVTSTKNAVLSLFRTLSAITRNIFNALRKFFNAVWTGIKNRTVAIVRAMWNSIKSIFYILRNTITSILNKLKNTIANIWNAIKNRVTNIVKITKDNVVNGFKGMYNAGKSWIDKLKNFIGDSVGGFKKAASKVGEGVANSAIGGLNAMIRGINSLSDKIMKKKLIKKEIPRVKLSTGTGIQVDNNGLLKRKTKAVVNDKGIGNGRGPSGHKELIYRRSGKIEKPIGNNKKVTLNRGDGVINGAQSQSLLPHFAKGTGFNPWEVTKGIAQKGYHKGVNGAQNLIEEGKELTGKAKKAFDKAIGDVMDYVKNPMKLVDKTMKLFGVDFSKVQGEAMGGMMKFGYKGLKNSIKDLVEGWFAEAEGGDGDSAWLLKHNILQTFGYYKGMTMNGTNRHWGVDFGMPVGTKIRALTDGKVTQAGWVNGGGGNQVTIEEPGGKWFQWYMHMVNGGVKVKKGQRVKAGDLLGLSGNTGSSNTPHLHIQRMKGYPSNDTAVDPMSWLKSLKGGGGSKAASKWRSDIVKAGKSMGVKLSGGDIKDIIRLIDTESSGNPRVKQGIQDVNSGGNEARGLLQYTPGTFAGYKAKGAGNILNGYHQLKAFFNNSNWRRDLSAWKSRMARGATGWGPTGSKRGYASGTNFARSGLANVFEKGGEIINFRGGEQVIPNDVSIAALKQMMSSDIFNQTQSAVYNGIAKYADALKEKDRLRAEQERKIRERNNNSGSSVEMQEMKAMMSEMLDVMKYMASNSDVIRDASVKTSNKNTSINKRDITDVINTEQGRDLKRAMLNMGVSIQ